MKEGLVVEPNFVYQEETHLTIMKTSVFFAGDGFTVYDSKGELVLRVDSYSPEYRDRAELVLMDAHGRCLLTVRRKRPSLHHRWEGYMGERTEGQKPLFGVRRSSIIGRSTMLVEIYSGNEKEEEEEEEEDEESYQIEGDFGQRSCKIINPSKELVAEIGRKVDASTHVKLGRDVLSLVLKPGFDGAFAMGLVLVLYQISGNDLADEPVSDID